MVASRYNEEATVDFTTIQVPTPQKWYQVLPLSNVSCINYRNTQCRAPYFRRDLVDYRYIPSSLDMRVGLLENIRFLDLSLNSQSFIELLASK